MPRRTRRAHGRTPRQRRLSAARHSDSDGDGNEYHPFWSSSRAIPVNVRANTQSLGGTSLKNTPSRVRSIRTRPSMAPAAAGTRAVPDAGPPPRPSTAARPPAGLSTAAGKIRHKHTDGRSRNGKDTPKALFHHSLPRFARPVLSPPRVASQTSHSSAKRRQCSLAAGLYIPGILGVSHPSVYSNGLKSSGL